MSIPKYVQIKNTLLNQIKNGEFEPGDKFYSEAELIDIFKVSSITVIRALKELVNDGYLFSVQGKGRFVSKGKIGQKVRFTDINRFPDEEIETVVLSIREIDDERIRKKLNAEATKKIYCFERLRKSAGVPFFLQYSYLTSDFIHDEDLTNPDSFVSINDKIKHDFNIQLSTSTSVEFYAIQFPTPKKIAELLEIDEMAPTSFAKRTTYLDHERVIEYVESYKHWEHYESKIETI
ncbi:hypothetical protein CBF34_06925 [Vagococcus penaei]|uniref:Uncharacterized protein n=1 Tax=Vagococcus penaei TaxID=633807 RepID=A0A1Q2D3I4_9ENTE|nr:GntR family transcriptional regulator [Vagococcus penaei]AQP52897.1 hypothetical protein BW732_00760 [Vagococcus penaei]RSU01386.1 hypothetical protein CBF34_06925 [Vagococcus penaei]